MRVAVFVLPVSALWALLPLYAKDELRLGAPGYGLLLGLFGAGAVIGGLGLPRLRRRFGPQRTTTAAALVFAGGLAAYLLVLFGSLAVGSAGGARSRSPPASRPPSPAWAQRSPCRGSSCTGSGCRKATDPTSRRRPRVTHFLHAAAPHAAG